MKEIKLKGFTSDCTPDNKPAVCVYGEENTGKTRFGCTAPHENGYIGWIAIDKNSKATIEEYKARNGMRVLVNEKPLMSNADAIRLAMEDDPGKVKEVYKRLIGTVFDMTVALAQADEVESIVIDSASQVFDWILFSHFGRRNQIESYTRGASNQDMIDLVNALSTKNLVLIHRANEIWKDTGEVDKNTGKKKQAPSGKFKPDGFGKIGGLVTATVELKAARKPGLELDQKYKCRIVTCKGNTLIEGEEPEQLTGEDISWPNLMNVIGVED